MDRRKREESAFISPSPFSLLIGVEGGRRGSVPLNAFPFPPRVLGSIFSLSGQRESDLIFVDCQAASGRRGIEETWLLDSPFESAGYYTRSCYYYRHHAPSRIMKAASAALRYEIFASN